MVLFIALPILLVHCSIEIKHYKQSEVWNRCDKSNDDIEGWKVLKKIDDCSRLRCLVAGESLDWVSYVCHFDDVCYMFDLTTGHAGSTILPDGRKCYIKKKGGRMYQR